jgi:hypothetical protein
MWKRYGKIFNVVVGITLLLIGVRFNLTSEVLKISHGLGLLFVGTGLMLLVGFVRKNTT